MAFSSRLHQRKLQSHLFQHAGQYNFITEVLARDRGGSFAISFVSRVDSLNGLGSFSHCRKGKEALTSRQDITETGLLSDDRAAGGKILCAALTKPSAPEAN